MTVTSGFFNSLEETEDRLYNANHFNEVFDGVVVPGVIQGVGDSLIVSESVDMNVLVGSGKAWFNMSWIKNDAPLNLPIGAAHPTLNRIDSIVMDFDKRDDVRENTIIVKAGTPGVTPVPPTMIIEEDHEQRRLADVYVGVGVEEITAANITNFVGTNECPFMTGLLEQLSTSEMIGQWWAMFVDWLEDLQNELDSNQVTNLQAQITELKKRPHRYRNLIQNSNMAVKQRPYIASPIIGGFNGYLGWMPDRWRVNLLVVGGYEAVKETEILPDGINARSWYRLNCYDTQDPLSASSLGYISQRIESNTLGEWMKGTVNAKPLVLTFMVKSNVTGTFVVELLDSNGWNISKSYTISQANVPELITIEIPAEPVMPISKVSIGTGLEVMFWTAAGSNYSSGASLKTTWGAKVDNRRAVGQTNIHTAEQYFAITEVQMTIGSTRYPYEEPDPVRELAICKRYCEAGYFAALGRAVQTDNLEIIGVPYDVKKRDSVTLTIVSASAYTPTELALWNRTPVAGLSQAQVIFTATPSSGTITAGTLFMSTYLYLAECDL